MKSGLVERINVYAKAITEPNRMKILKILGSSQTDSMSVSKIAQMLHISQPAVSKHLQILSLCGFVTRKKIGNTVYYSVSREAIEDFQTAMEHGFSVVWTPCQYDYDCENCPVAQTCQ
ncbi:MAG: winged helix-turn-helix transcriptional regulator [Lachnospiraceae bacterium]|nr:winged helix-turn-helix transcriptional regulator [Lachnospiraceae bacterium]